eukprot:CAMPEP_0197834966 /NCGR_PEP_ID=MMETSP1437-20131217/24269_1 /TAXON_ID=49252 ORGANISM="Eucampia antarctica, Strain CCMP1452" /NCGR_SAMPLE_ID=MMETSP1437 /ASSEMBLY_ACC=CAM_ASM_001096 /LENGTH=69 /DNA_ID=CAMNT_0043440045 /DNA_START=314 /DNA_END=520 /DNA_ORIENTATION=+
MEVPNLRRKNELFPLGATSTPSINDDEPNDEPSSPVAPLTAANDNDSSEDKVLALWPCGDELDKRMIKF